MKLNHEMCNAVFSRLPINTKRHIVCIIQEMRSAEERHPDWPKDVVHQAAIVGEESGELLQAALNYTYEKGRFYSMHNEAIQNGAVVLRFLDNLPIKKLPGEQEDDCPTFKNPAWKETH